MFRPSLTFIFAVSCGVAVALPARAATQGNVPAGGTMASTCSGTQFSTLPNMGHEITPAVGRNCSTQISATGNNVSLNTSASGTLGTGNNAHFYTTNSNVTSGIGGISLYAENHGSSATAFSGSQAMGGWTDAITIAGTAGATAYWVVPINVVGVMSATGVLAMSQVEIYAFKNGANPSIYTNFTAFNLFKTLNAPLATGDANSYLENQAKSFRQIDYGANDFVPINQTVSFVIPFSYNVEFNLGIYAVAGAGEASSGAFIEDNIAVSSAGVSWGGPGYVTGPSGAGQFITPTITSRSGYNYNVTASAPEPASWAMMIMGFGAIGFALRSRYRQTLSIT